MRSITGLSCSSYSLVFTWWTIGGANWTVLYLVKMVPKIDQCPYKRSNKTCTTLIILRHCLLLYTRAPLIFSIKILSRLDVITSSSLTYETCSCFSCTNNQTYFNLWSPIYILIVISIIKLKIWKLYIISYT